MRPLDPRLLAHARSTRWFLAFTVGVGSAGSAIVVRYGRAVPWFGICIPAGLGLGAFSWFLLVQPDMTWRILATNFAFGAISLVVAAELRTVTKTSLADRFLFVLTLLVTVHELGHFLVARWLGVAVDRFSIGFGRAIFSFTDRGGVEWRFGWIPLGGYVRFAGDAEASSSVPDEAALAEMREKIR